VERATPPKRKNAAAAALDSTQRSVRSGSAASRKKAQAPQCQTHQRQARRFGDALNQQEVLVVEFVNTLTVYKLGPA
jgi:hypothetical protein